MVRDCVTVHNSGDDIEVIALDRRPRDGRVRFVFSDHLSSYGPVSLRVRNPAGKIVIERVLREIPTREGSLVAPVSVPINEPGDYSIEVKPIKTLEHRGPTSDPWELHSSVRRVAQSAVQSMAAFLRVA